MARGSLLVARVVRTVGIVMIMIGFSVAFGYLMALMQVPAKAATSFSVADDKYSLLLLITCCSWCSAPSWTSRRCC